MKLTTGILAMTMMAGGAWAQNPNVIDNAHATTKAAQQKQANEGNAALASAGTAKPIAKPAPGAPPPAVKPAIIVASKPASPQASPTATQRNELKRVDVVQGKDDVQIEIASRGTVKPKLSTLKSPARVVVELPETVMATAQSHITVGSSGVKGVRIGMDGKTPPTTSVVVDMEKACAYELNPGPEGKLVLTLHTSEAAASATPKAAVKPVSAPAAPVKVASKPAVTSTAKSSAAPAPAAKAQVVAATPAITATKPAAASKTPVASKTTVAAKPTVAAQKTTKETKAPAPAATKPAAEGSKTADAKQPKPASKPEEKKWAMNGKRDPFFSPVVQQTGGSGCSTGKKCLEIGQINLKGVVKSDTGFIAVVTNSLNKAYFLRENDPVFNGYVVRITGDSVVFQETVQDKLGKPLTHEVVKRIFTPAV
jgi:Tfp pilus assembly protein PilP